MNFTKETKMHELIHFNYLVLPILDRFGIKLGFGNKNIKQVCDQYTVDSDFFLAIKLNIVYNYLLIVTP